MSGDLLIYIVVHISFQAVLLQGHHSRETTVRKNLDLSSIMGFPSFSCYTKNFYEQIVHFGLNSLNAIEQIIPKHGKLRDNREPLQ